MLEQIEMNHLPAPAGVYCLEEKSEAYVSTQRAWCERTTRTVYQFCRRVSIPKVSFDLFIMLMASNQCRICLNKNISSCSAMQVAFLIMHTCSIQKQLPYTISSGRLASTLFDSVKWQTLRLK